MTITTETQLVDALNKGSNTTLSVDDYLAWLDGDAGGDAKKFDDVVRSRLGEHLYNSAEACARLNNVLWVVLGGKVQPMYEQDVAEAIIECPQAYENGF